MCILVFSNRYVWSFSYIWIQCTWSSSGTLTGQEIWAWIPSHRPTRVCLFVLHTIQWECNLSPWFSLEGVGLERWNLSLHSQDFLNDSHWGVFESEKWEELSWGHSESVRSFSTGIFFTVEVNFYISLDTMENSWKCSCLVQESAN